MLPFYHGSFIIPEDVNQVAPDIITDHDRYLEAIRNQQGLTSIAHINTHSLLSSFDEFRILLLIYEIDIKMPNET